MKAVKCWIEPEWDDDEVWGHQWKRTWYRDRSDILPAIAVPLDLLERLLCVVADMEVTDDERDHLQRLCREMREEVGNG